MVTHSHQTFSLLIGEFLFSINSQTSLSMVIMPFHLIITSKEMSFSGLYLLINLYVHTIEAMVFLVVVWM